MREWIRLGILGAALLTLLMAGLGFGNGGCADLEPPVEGDANGDLTFQIPQPAKADAAAVGFLPAADLAQVEESLDVAIAATEGVIHDLETEIARLERDHEAKATEIANELRRIEQRKDELERNQTIKTVGGVVGVFLGIITLQPALIVGGSAALAAAIADDSRIQQSERNIARARQEQRQIESALRDYRQKRDALRARLAPLREAKAELLGLLAATASVEIPEGPDPELNSIAWRVDLLRQILINNEDQIVILTEIRDLAQSVDTQIDETLVTVRELAAEADALLESSENDFHVIVALITSQDPLAAATNWLIDEIAARAREVLESYSWPLAEFVDFLVDNRAQDWDGALDDLRERLIDHLINAVVDELLDDEEEPDDEEPDDEPQPVVPAALVAGNSYACSLSAHAEVACWGWDEVASIPAAGGSLVTLGSASGEHVCGLNSDGLPVCWGYNHRGQTDAPNEPLVDVSTGSDFSCGIRRDASVACWGHEAMTPPEGRFVALSAGGFFACGIRADGTLACWGSNADGELRPPDGQFIDVSGGRDHACAIREDRSVTCWGSDHLGQSRSPDVALRDVSAGEWFSCGVVADSGSLICWGAVDDIGQGLHIVPEGSYLTVSAGLTHACALRDDGGVLCWGKDYVGETQVPSGLDLF